MPVIRSLGYTDINVCGQTRVFIDLIGKPSVERPHPMGVSLCAHAVVIFHMIFQIADDGCSDDYTFYRM